MMSGASTYGFPITVKRDSVIATNPNGETLERDNVIALKLAVEAYWLSDEALQMTGVAN